jgi:hypothetical protein
LLSESFEIRVASRGMPCVNTADWSTCVSDSLIAELANYEGTDWLKANKSACAVVFLKLSGNICTDSFVNFSFWLAKTQ